MGCRIIAYGRDDDGNGVECAVFYCSTTGVAFGRILSDLEEAESFQSWVYEKYNKDLRILTDKQFEDYLNQFRDEREGEEK
jgi:hypothetical protein